MEYSIFIQFFSYFQYNPVALTDLKPGETRYWCRCGLSQKQPWCDGIYLFLNTCVWVCMRARLRVCQMKSLVPTVLSTTIVFLSYHF